MKTFAGILILLAAAFTWAARAEVKLGNEVLAERQFKVLQTKRVGLIPNPSGVNRQ